VLDVIASLGRSRQVFVMARQELERELGLVLTGLVVEPWNYEGRVYETRVYEKD
jgi:hypothetical protein